MADKAISASTGEVKIIGYSSAENPFSLVDALRQKHNIYEKRHLVKDGSSVKVVSDGFSDVDKEIQSELKNAGLQNILKLQEMRYGTLDNAIARANDRGVYADVSKIPDGVGPRAEAVADAQDALTKLCQEFGISKEDALKLSGEDIAGLYQKKYAQPEQNNTPQNEGGAQ